MKIRIFDNGASHQLQADIVDFDKKLSEQNEPFPFTIMLNSTPKTESKYKTDSEIHENLLTNSINTSGVENENVFKLIIEIREIYLEDKRKYANYFIIY